MDFKKPCTCDDGFVYRKCVTKRGKRTCKVIGVYKFPCRICKQG